LHCIICNTFIIIYKSY